LYGVSPIFLLAFFAYNEKRRDNNDNYYQKEIKTIIIEIFCRHAIIKKTLRYCSKNAACEAAVLLLSGK
ncbi:hypothetical protein AXI59_02450, partial [Bacillus nakamurai]|uniref:hypothetical protein n=1 Tax=Bacillus nakamurai TaxID=1793963 RepID=UPI000778781E